MAHPAIIKTAQQYINQIPKDWGLKKSFLFGSYANGNPTEDSDIDIAIIFENQNDFYANQMLLMKLRRNIDLRIEPHPIHEKDFTSDNPFAYEIQKKGIALNL
ncbi:MAG TPA: nucleotidyltransferase [Flavobacterium sp.]|nr:nucleotidyltransferase [Flavobacterium sp.]